MVKNYGHLILEKIKNEDNRTVGIEAVYIDTVKKKTESGGENHKWSCSTVDAPFLWILALC